jgi:hypothetical protein
MADETLQCTNADDTTTWDSPRSRHVLFLIRVSLEIDHGDIRPYLCASQRSA